MINSTELKNTQLRRLNKVLYKGYIKTIDCISPGYVAFLEDRPNSDNFGEWIDLDKVEFIKLTKEILYEKINSTFWRNEITFGEACFEFFNGKLYYSAGEGCQLSKEIKYLHQLQNIVFDLYNQELEIKL